MLHKVTFKLTVFTLKVQFVRMTSGQIGTVVQIQNIGDCETSVAYIDVSPASTFTRVASLRTRNRNKRN